MELCDSRPVTHSAGCSWSHVCCSVCMCPYIIYSILGQTTFYSSINWLVDNLDCYFLWIPWVPSIWRCRYRLCIDLFLFSWGTCCVITRSHDITFNHFRICPTAFQTAVAFKFQPATFECLTLLLFFLFIAPTAGGAKVSDLH